MHTSTGADAIDEYAETIVRKAGQPVLSLRGRAAALLTERIVAPYRTADGHAGPRVHGYRTHHGPVVRAAGDKWITRAGS